jgi:SAM-dependent methyltransferase
LPSVDLPVPWLRFPDEATVCPACASPEITLLDALSIRRSPDGRGIAFLTGCHACGLLFANPLPTAEQLQQYYSDHGKWAARSVERLDKIEKAYRRMAGTTRPPKPGKVDGGPELLLKALAPYVPVHAPPPGARALDFGCGDGKLLNRLQERGWETYGIEPSTHVPFLRHRRMETLPQDASLDFVVLHHVLEHLTAPLATLRQLAGSMREGGVLFIGMPRLDTLPQHGDLAYCIDGREHLVSCSERCLEGLLARAGFATVARLDVPALDALRTAGKPRRLRVVARRTASPQPLADAPIAPALDALRRHVQINEPFTRRVFRILPVRLRGALMDRARQRQRRKRRRALP